MSNTASDQLIALTITFHTFYTGNVDTQMIKVKRKNIGLSLKSLLSRHGRAKPRCQHFKRYLRVHFLFDLK